MGSGVVRVCVCVFLKQKARLWRRFLLSSLFHILTGSVKTVLLDLMRIKVYDGPGLVAQLLDRIRVCVLHTDVGG